MDNLADKTVLVYDNGSWTSLARRLAEDFGRVLYFSPWACAFPKSAAMAIGDGLPGVERIANVFEWLDAVDLWVFPDVYHGDLQAYLRKLGKRVWGSGKGESLELDRFGARDLFRGMGLNQPETQRVIGVGPLADYLRRAPECWVKVSAFRDDMETFHHETWPQSESFLEWLKARLGKLGDAYEFLVEAPIEGIECGYDGWCVAGHYPSVSCWGYELKDKAYIGRVSPVLEMPTPIRETLDRMSPVLQDMDVRGFLSTEIRVAADGRSYLTDPCIRAASPPTEVLMEMVENLAEVMWEGAAGRVVEPQWTARFAALANVRCPWALENWVPITADEEDDYLWLKIKNECIIGGQRYHVPITENMTEIGAVIGMGDTLEDAVAAVEDRTKLLHGYTLEVCTASLQGAKEEIEKGQGLGIPWEGKSA